LRLKNVEKQPKLKIKVTSMKICLKKQKLLEPKVDKESTAFKVMQISADINREGDGVC